MPVTHPEYEYTYEKSVTSPLDCIHNEDGEIRRLKENIRPLQGFGPVNNIIAKPTSKKKFIYTMRHGQAQHNALSNEYTKPIAWRFLPKLAANFDPGLTPEGVQEARHAGQLLRELIRDEGAPRPAVVYTSPLRRCVQTAMLALGALRPAAAPGRRITLCVQEGLREWKGFDHGHQADRRTTSPHLRRLVGELRRELGLADDAVRLVLDGRQDAEDDPVMRETYVDVDRRVRAVLDGVFGADGAGCCLLVLHNRSSHAVLRVMGHTQDEVRKLDTENGAVLGFLVKRTLMSSLAAQSRFEQEKKNWHSARALALEEKQDRHDRAAKDVEGYRRNDVAKLRRLKDYLAHEAERNDKEACKALVDLDMMVREMKQLATGQVPRKGDRGRRSEIIHGG